MAHTNSRNVPRGRTTSAAPNLTSSLNHRTPARSFIHHTSQYLPDPAQYSSYGVRAQTAELASWAVNESISFDNGTLSQSSPLLGSSSLLPRERRSQLDDANGIGKPSESGGASLRDAIEEISEPVTPKEAQLSSATGPRTEAPGAPGLSDIFRIPSIVTSHVKLPTHIENENPENEHSHLAYHRSGCNSIETTPLLRKQVAAELKHNKASRSTSDIEAQLIRNRKRNKLQQVLSNGRQQTVHVVKTLTNPKSWDRQAIWEQGIKQPIGLLPCVFLGLLLNILDALSYGMILFPLGEPIFANTGADGIAMFYVSCIISQLVFSLGGSIFKGAVGSEMIEVVPFFHKMTYMVLARTGQSQPQVVLATVITSYAISSILTGIVFLGLGALKLGSLANFFPRHILIGCIGGVGFFLFMTGIEVSARLPGSLEYNLQTLQHLFEPDTLALWTVPLALSITLTIAKRFNNSPYVVPTFFIAIAGVFYLIVAAVSSLKVPDLRKRGWIFGKVAAGVPFYHFYSYYDFKVIDWKALASTIPAMFALTFFGILHVPINVPALAIAAEEDDLNLNRELVAHGISNALSGFAGSIQNYLVYVNSEMFIHNGGNSRLAGVLLAAATFAILVAGPAMIGYVPVMVVGALIFYLGISLLEEALWEPWGKTNRLEYLTIVAIVLIMGIYDFVAGILAGIVLACLNFVVQTSRKSTIRACYSGEIVESTVRRHPVHRHFLHKVGNQIYVTKLSGFLFFGSIVKVEKQSRALIEDEAFKKQPIRYLIFDLAHVHGVDYSAAEAFTRIERILGRRDVKMIISGIHTDDEVGKSLRNAELWKDGSSVEFFENMNGALEYCENELLRIYYQERDALQSSDHPQALDILKSETALSTPATTTSSEHYFSASPRQSHLRHAAATTLDTQPAEVSRKWQSYKQPLPLILNTFQDLSDKKEDFWINAVSYFDRGEYRAGEVLFSRGDSPNGFFLLQTGILRANYYLPTGHYTESIVAGTTCGELPFFSQTSRTATVVAELESVAWRMSEEGWDRMQEEWPDGSRELLKVALRLTKERMDAVTGYVLMTAG